MTNELDEISQTSVHGIIEDAEQAEAEQYHGKGGSTVYILREFRGHNRTILLERRPSALPPPYTLRVVTTRKFRVREHAEDAYNKAIKEKRRAP